MRVWLIVSVAVFVTAVAWHVTRGRDEEMFIRLGDRDLKSLPA